MQYVSAHGAKIPAIGFGTWQARAGECVEAVTYAIAAGYRHIDTAANYGNEEEVGEGIRNSGVPRDDIFLTTKIASADLAEGDMQKAAERSLKRLGFDQVDLILIHWPSRTIPTADTIRSLNDVKRRGMTRHIGVSNFTIRHLDEAWAATEAPLVTNQCEYHPRLDQSKLLAACRARGMSFTSYAPIGRGEVLGEAAIRQVAARLGKTPAQVVLRWHIQQDGVIAIPKSSNPERIRENISLFDFELTQEDMSAISAVASADGRVVNPASIAPDWD